MRPAAKRPLLLILLPLFCCGLLFFFCSRHSLCLSPGLYLRGNGGTDMVILQSGAPIIMRDRSRDGALFDGLSDGDRVLVLHTGIAESYPGQSTAYLCLRLGGGSAADLPADTLEQLAQLGWLSGPT